MPSYTICPDGFPLRAVGFAVKKAFSFRQTCIYTFSCIKAEPQHFPTP